MHKQADGESRTASALGWTIIRILLAAVVLLAALAWLAYELLSSA